MHFYSYLSAVGIAIITIASAQDKVEDLTNGNVTYGAYNPIAVDAPYANATTKRSVKLVARGTSVQRNVLKRATLDGICQNLPSKWSHRGCYADTVSTRVLSGDSTSGDDMSQEKCIEFCDGKGYSFAGVEWGRECFCGYALPKSALKALEGDCSKPCTGNRDEVCGDGGRINIFWNGDAAPEILAQSGDFNSIGCYSDTPSARALTTGISLSGGVRVSDCTTACAAQGYQFAGVEFGRECFCGASIQNGAKPISAESCNMACTADKTQYCGGAAAINIYQNSKIQKGGPSKIPDLWTSKNCYTDSPSKRILSYKVPSFDKFSAASCISKCAGLNYLYAGLEYGSECFCGNTIDNGNTPATSGCDMQPGRYVRWCWTHNLYVAPCQGVPGCHINVGLYKILKVKTPEQCSDACHADSRCQAIQLGPLPFGYKFCNLFDYAIPIVRTNVGNDICNAYNFFDSACSL
ncbi:WSC domain-containing protein [Colletotrichum spaethianum]|uniref:WSC domain-containing protein n=1 Tax=Colletotrichum spaethianum TaxID=700344 RepID=A0AA37P8X4_9PEZI|nr:WSC domain-containing protein [Colletotrichum spaethianum]GKT47811.1 WSC domain-containing protein [Colletotrichum spaethianum]